VKGGADISGDLCSVWHSLERKENLESSLRRQTDRGPVLKFPFCVIDQVMLINSLVKEKQKK